MKGRLSLRIILVALLLAALVGAVARYDLLLRFYALHAPVWGARTKLPPRDAFAAQIVAGARRQIGTVYDASYASISYPGGDVPPDRGACSDVVVRSLRHAGIDLQPLIHEDILRAPAEYRRIAADTGPDPNIDHRRCLNQMQFLSRHGQTLPTDLSPSTRDQWQPGDFVYWRFPDGRQHVGVLSDRADADSRPLVIHNAGVCREEDCLTRWEIIGHYRYTP